MNIDEMIAKMEQGAIADGIYTQDEIDEIDRKFQAMSNEELSEVARKVLVRLELFLEKAASEEKK